MKRKIECEGYRIEEYDKFIYVIFEREFIKRYSFDKEKLHEVMKSVLSGVKVGRFDRIVQIDVGKVYNTTEKIIKDVRYYIERFKFNEGNCIYSVA